MSNINISNNKPHMYLNLTKAHGLKVAVGISFAAELFAFNIRKFFGTYTEIFLLHS